MKNYDAIKGQFVQREVKACISDDEEPETELQEIYEYWIVTPWLGEKLREKGEVVYETWGGWIWGRTCTGPILLDSVISSICHAHMGILKGPHEAFARW